MQWRHCCLLATENLTPWPIVTISYRWLCNSFSIPLLCKVYIYIQPWRDQWWQQCSTVICSAHLYPIHYPSSHCRCLSTKPQKLKIRLQKSLSSTDYICTSISVCHFQFSVATKRIKTSPDGLILNHWLHYIVHIFTYTSALIIAYTKQYAMQYNIYLCTQLTTIQVLIFLGL